MLKQLEDSPAVAEAVAMCLADSRRRGADG